MIRPGSVDGMTNRLPSGLKVAEWAWPAGTGIGMTTRQVASSQTTSLLPETLAAA